VFSTTVEMVYLVLLLYSESRLEQRENAECYNRTERVAYNLVVIQSRN
jgi:hypothetical protein